MNYTKEELKGMRDRKEITQSEFVARVQKMLPKTEIAPPVPQPIPEAGPNVVAEAIDRAAIKSNVSIQEQTSMIEKALNSMLLSLNTTKGVERIAKFTVSRNSKDLVTEIVAHYSKI